MVELIQPSFSKGELSPELHGRVDINADRDWETSSLPLLPLEMNSHFIY